MGLAASQARLLFITLRQNDVSANMQRVSNDTMVLARDKDIVAEKYEQMLNEKSYKLKDDVDLSYDALMGGTAIDSLGNVNIVTNNDGRVVLSGADKTKYGLTADVGNKGDFAKIYPTVDDFIKQADPTNAEAIIAAKPVTTPSADGATDASGLTDDDKKQIQIFTNTYGTYPTNTKMFSINDILSKMSTVGNMQNIKTYGSDRWSDCNKEISAYSYTQLSNGNYSAQDGKYIRLATEGDRRGVPGDMAKNNMNIIASTFKEAILKAMGLSEDSTTANKLTNIVSTIANYVGGWNGNMSKEIASKEDTGYATGTKLSEIVKTTATSTRGGADNDHMWLDVQKLFNMMLDVAIRSVQDEKSGSVLSMTGVGNKNQVMASTVNSKGFTLTEWKEKLKNAVGSAKYEQALAYLQPKTTSSSSAGEVTNTQKYKCYEALYNNINNYGWSVEDTSSIQEKLKNGTYRLNGTALANNTDLYEEVTSTDSTAKAEAYWKVEMQKISTKEKKLETELTKLQTEYSSLTSDYESVNSIIQKNISRSFTYCQNG